MRKTWVVVRREFVERVRTKWFVVSTVVGPILMLSFIVVPIMLATKGARERTIVVIDATGDGFGWRLTATLDEAPVFVAERLPARLGELERKADSLAGYVGLRVLDGFLMVTDQALEDGRIEYRGSNVSSPRDMSALESIIQEAIFTERLSRAGVDHTVVRRARAPVHFRTLKIAGAKTTEASGEGSFILAYLIWMLLYMGIVLYGVNVLGSVVEEKTSRIVELLVSSLKPFELLAGKIIGVGGVGLFQFLIWIGFGALVIHQRELVLNLLGQPTAAGAPMIPEIPLATVVIFLLYFLLGYFLYASLFAAVGAMTGSEAEARQAANVVIMLLVLPSILMIGILNDPNGSMAVNLSLVPFTSPIAMPVRWAAGEVPWNEVVLSLVLLGLALWGVIWIAGRIYRVGILMYGKRPAIREIARWVVAK